MNAPVTTRETEELEAARRIVAEELAREERLVLLLVYAEGLSFAEIAEVLDLSVAAVERRYRATMAALRERLGC
jgi:RNA polymerase sigma factor (sigma-70 family)